MTTNEERNRFFDSCFHQIRHTNLDHYLTDFEETFKVDYNLVRSVANEMEERGWATIIDQGLKSIRITYDGEQILKNYGSYTNWLRHQAKEEQVQNTVTKRKHKLEVFAVVIAGLTLLFSIYQHFSNKANVEKLEQRIETLESKIAVTESE